jgi:hypothetical protein
MMRHLFKALLATPIALIACSSNGGSGQLLGGGGSDVATGTGSLAAGENATYQHLAQLAGPDNGYTDVAARQLLDDLIGPPDVVARMHSASKITYAELGAMLTDFGVDMSSTTAGSAAALYKAGASALGVANFANRVPEQIIPTTSSLAKQFDIFAAAAPEILANIGNSKRCPGVVLVTNDEFTSDGISCLIGKPAHPEHVTLANAVVTSASAPQIGLQIAVATMLSAAHTSE